MFHLASDFENQLPNASDWHNPCCIPVLIDNIRDTLNVSCFGGTFRRDKWCLGLPRFTAKIISLHCPIWQVKVRTLKTSCLMLVTDTILVTFLHWLVWSETLRTHSPSVVLLVGPNGVWAYRVSMRKMIPLQCSIWQVTLKTSYLLLVTNTNLVAFMHWLVRSETL